MQLQMKRGLSLFVVILLAIALMLAAVRLPVRLPVRTPVLLPVREPVRERIHDHKAARDVLVLDLDETLVHALPPDYEDVLVRPQVPEFLAAVSRMYDEVVVFTAGTRDYASPVLDRLDPDGRVFGRRLYRDSCTVLGPSLMLVKDLRVLGEADLARVTIVDNTPSAYALQPQCGVAVASFTGDPGDRALMQDVLPELRRRLLVLST